MSKLSWEDLASEIAAAPVGSERLDQMFWSRERGGGDYPLPHYDLDTWESCCSEVQPEAQISTRVESVMRLIEETYPKHRLNIRMENGLAQIDFEILSFGAPLRHQYKGPLAPHDLARGIAAAFVPAHAQAINLAMRMFATMGLAEKLPPMSEWDREEHNGGVIFVDHANRLLALGFKDDEAAERNKDIWRKTDYTVMLARERYEKAFPETEPDVPGL